MSTKINLEAIALIVAIIGLLFVGFLFVDAINKYEDFEDTIKDIETSLKFVNDKEIYEAKIELPSKINTLLQLRRVGVKDIITKCLPYLDKQTALRYKLMIYKGEIK
jgi:ethanolamine utilization cobalamin adenosyltransferase